MNKAQETEARWNGLTYGMRLERLLAMGLETEEAKLFSSRKWNGLPLRLKDRLKGN